MKKNQQKNQHTQKKTGTDLYRSYILSTWISCKKKTNKQLQPTILCTLPKQTNKQLSIQY